MNGMASASFFSRLEKRRQEREYVKNMGTLIISLANGRALLSLYEVLGRSNASGLVGHFRYEKEDRRTKGVSSVA